MRLGKVRDISACGAFTITELLVILAIIGLLVALLLPSLAGARRKSLATACASNLRSVGQLDLIYANDNRGWLYDETQVDVFVRSWMACAVGPIGSREAQVMLCPTGVGEENFTYVINDFTRDGWCRLGKIGSGTLSASEAVLLGENVAEREENTAGYYDVLGQPSPPYDEFRHGPQLRSNHLFLDWHVDSRSVNNVNNRRREPWAIP